MMQSCTFISRPTLEEIDAAKRCGAIDSHHPLYRGCPTYSERNSQCGPHGFGCKCVAPSYLIKPPGVSMEEMDRVAEAAWPKKRPKEPPAPPTQLKPKTRGEEIAEKEIRDNRLSADKPESFFCMAAWVSAPSVGRDLAMRCVRRRLANLIDEAIADEREACAKVAETNMGFTGAGYCDMGDPKSDPARMHDYGRGGCDARKAIAGEIRRRLQS